MSARELESSNRRVAFRCPLEAFNEVGVLRTRRGEFSVRVVDRSASGFGVLAPRRAGVKVGAVVTLVAAGGAHPARVMHVAKEGGELRVGLTHLELSAAPARPESSGGRLLALGLVGAALVAGFVGGAAIWTRGGAASSAAQASAPRALFGLGDATNPADAERLLAEQVLRLNQLETPETQRALEMTPEQTRQAREALARANESLSRIVARKEHESRWSILGLRVVSSTLQEMQGVLTPEQWRKWRQDEPLHTRG